ncbi:uncharacterized protein LOC129741860 [Uranotaenia lowii]|uniref:uncharacterized protein LOC129741860 n=1 Tax=Uranotaenia lowii TaxID=190385 RepID=UPI00247A1506|nr:uncharacterized protein LOC129741860 [Uranotaenia lowii]
MNVGSILLTIFIAINRVAKTSPARPLLVDSWQPPSDFSRYGFVTGWHKEVTSQEPVATVTSATAFTGNPSSTTTCTSEGRMPGDDAETSSRFADHMSRSESLGSQRAPFADPFDPVEMSTLFPTLANGHLGFTVFGDAVYMDGLFNGHRGLSHRARIANVANLRLQLEEEGTSAAGNLTSSRDGFRMDFRTGTFCVDYRGPNNSFRVTQRIYPHQSFDRAIVNQFEIMRLDGDGDLNIVLSQPYTLPGSEDIVFTPTETETVFADQSNDDEDVADDQQDGTGAHEPERRRRPLFSNPNRWAIKQSGPAGRNKYSSAEPSHHHQQQQQQQRPAWVLHRSCGHTLEPEIPEESRPGPQQLRQVCVLWNHVPEELTLERSEQSVSYRFIMTVDESAKVARDELLQDPADGGDAINWIHLLTSAGVRCSQLSAKNSQPKITFEPGQFGAEKENPIVFFDENESRQL